MPGWNRDFPESNRYDSGMRPLTESESDHRASSLPEPEEPVAAAQSDTSWLGSVRTVGLLTLFSRLLGLIRDMGMAAVFGNGPLLDSFTLAFRIPNLCRRLFGEGALTTAFLPEFVKTQRSDATQARRLASAVWLVLLLLLSVLVLLGEAFLLWGLSADTTSLSAYQLQVMTAWMLPYVILICLSAQFGAVLNALGDFAVPAFVPVLLNVVWIAALWWVVPAFADPWLKMKIVMQAVLWGGVAQLVVPWWFLYRRGMAFDTGWWRELQRTRKVFRVMLPIVAAMSVSQVNAICDSSLAWWYSQPEQGEWVSPGMASALYFGQRMYQFPLGVFGIALGTVIFARLAHHVQAGAREQIGQDVRDGLRLVLVIGLPATLGMMLLAEPLTRALLERGEFSPAHSRQTAATVMAYASAIWAYLGVTLVQRVFYALEDTRTPVRIGFVAVFVNVVLNFVLLFVIGGTGLAYATAISAVIQFWILTHLARWRLGIAFGTDFRRFCLQCSLATVGMSLACWGTLQLLRSLRPEISQMVQLLIPCLVAIGVYAGLLRLMQVPELELLMHSGSRRRKW